MFDKFVVSFLVDEVAGGFFVSVSPGHVATVYDWGRGVLKNVWGPGLHFKIPFWQTVKIFNAQTLEYTIREGFNPDLAKEGLGDAPINASTLDRANIQVEGTILLKIDKEQVVGLWENVGDDFVSKIVRPVSRSRFRSVVAGVNYTDITQRRHEVEEKLKETLTADLHPKGLIVEGVLLSDVKTSPH